MKTGTVVQASCFYTVIELFECHILEASPNHIACRQWVQYSGHELVACTFSSMFGIEVAITVLRRVLRNSRAALEWRFFNRTTATCATPVHAKRQEGHIGGTYIYKHTFIHPVWSVVCGDSCARWAHAPD